MIPAPAGAAAGRSEPRGATEAQASAHVGGCASSYNGAPACDALWSGSQWSPLALLATTHRFRYPTTQSPSPLNYITQILTTLRVAMSCRAKVSHTKCFVPSLLLRLQVWLHLLA